MSKRSAVQHLQERPLSALDAIFSRRSVRAYADQPLDEATVRALLEAAVQAPTAMHSEPWVFLVVQDREVLRRVSDRAKGSWAQEAAHYRDLHHPGDAAAASAFATRFASPNFCVFYDAGTLIVIGVRRPAPFAAADCWLAAENLMLAASALGLGTCCIGSAVPALNRPETKAELNLPGDLELIAPIIVGVPRDSAAAVSRKDPDIAAWLRPAADGKHPRPK
jgi:nitroreductase